MTIARGNKYRNSHTVSSRTRLLLVLLCVGVAGMAIVLFMMKTFAGSAADVFGNEAVASYANRGAFTNLTEIFQIPALLFFCILVAYSVSELYKSYRAMNDPETYRNRKADRSAGIQPGGVAGRAQKREIKRAAKASKHKVTRSKADSSRMGRARRTPLH